MSITDTLIALGVLAGLAATYRLGRHILQRFGSLERVSVELVPATARRTPGEIHRELWEQKGRLDWAVEASARARVAHHQAATATPTSWHAPDAPCEVEG